MLHWWNVVAKYDVVFGWHSTYSIKGVREHLLEIFYVVDGDMVCNGGMEVEWSCKGGMDNLCSYKGKLLCLGPVKGWTAVLWSCKEHIAAVVDANSS